MIEKLNPFAGLKRKRLPGMHLITAVQGGADLQNALAAHFFLMLHDSLKHDCLIEKALQKQKEAVDKAIELSKSMEGATLSSVFGQIGNIGLISEEWSYISQEDAFVFYLISGTAIEQTQRWIAEGVEKPYNLGKLFGEGPERELVQRPEWAKKEFGKPDSKTRAEYREYVMKLTAEVEAAERSARAT